MCDNCETAGRQGPYAKGLKIPAAASRGGAVSHHWRSVDCVNEGVKITAILYVRVDVRIFESQNESCSLTDTLHYVSHKTDEEPGEPAMGKFN